MGPYRGNRVVAWRGGKPLTLDDYRGAQAPAEDQPAPDTAGTARDAVERHSGPDPATTEAPAGDESVPDKAADVVAWIREGGEQSDDEGKRRAGLAWSAETQRSGGIRSTVEDEVDRWLFPDSHD